MESIDKSGHLHLAEATQRCQTARELVRIGVPVDYPMNYLSELLNQRATG